MRRRSQQTQQLQVSLENEELGALSSCSVGLSRSGPTKSFDSESNLNKKHSTYKVAQVVISRSDLNLIVRKQEEPVCP